MLNRHASGHRSTVAIAGQLSRRRFIGQCLTGAAILGAVPIPAQALNRMSKAASKYQNQPNGDERCGHCRHFQPPGSCEIVPGRISPHGWCKWFRAGRSGSMEY